MKIKHKPLGISLPLSAEERKAKTTNSKPALKNKL